MIEKPIIQKLATKHNLPLKVVEEIVFHQFKYVAMVMKNSNFESVRLPYFGKFWVKPGRVRHLNKKSENKNKRNANEKFN